MLSLLPFLGERTDDNNVNQLWIHTKIILIDFWTQKELYKFVQLNDICISTGIFKDMQNFKQQINHVI
jgi:hypothetical protein